MQQHLAMRVLVVALFAVGCKSAPHATKATQEAVGIRLLSGDASDALPASGVRLVGVDAAGSLVDHGAPDGAVKITGDRVTWLSPGKPFEAASITDGTMAVVVVDANRNAKDVEPALATLDHTCTGYAVIVGDKLGAVKPTPCPASPVPAPDAHRVQIVVAVKAGGATVGLTGIDEVTKDLANTDLAKKLADYKKTPFFDSCSDAARPDTQDDKPADNAGAGTAMALDEGKMGGAPSTDTCNILLAFDDATKMAEVVDTFRIAIASGFKSARWVPPSALPAFAPSPPDQAKGPDVSGDPDVVKAKKLADDARARLNAMTADSSKSADDIKRAMDASRAADHAYKEAKKQARARATGGAPAN